MLESALDHVDIHQHNRHLICQFKSPFLVISTCSINGGQRDDLQAIVNHQSCEGRAHLDRAHHIVDVGPRVYHRELCEECSLPESSTACMGTAANMQYAMSKVETWDDLTIQAIVTAGVTGNALRAGDPARYHEFEGEWKPVAAIPGTINTILLINRPLSPTALARSVLTMCEGKSAALQDLSVGSLSSRRLATGTGTDQYAIASMIDNSKASYTWSGGHTRLGELIGRAVHGATKEAIQWQNGLHPQLTRSCFHLLGRFGLKKELFREKIKAQCPEAQATFLISNELAIEHDPQVSSACLALASILDAFENGMLPEHLHHQKISQHLALMASSLSGQLENMPAFYGLLQHKNWIEAFIDAIALGFKHKWTP
jgi:adenosylcobinamide hydrolase